MNLSQPDPLLIWQVLWLVSLSQGAEVTTVPQFDTSNGLAIQKTHSDDLAAIPTSAHYYWGDLTAISTPPQLINSKESIQSSRDAQHQPTYINHMNHIKFVRIGRDFLD